MVEREANHRASGAWTPFQPEGDVQTHTKGKAMCNSRQMIIGSAILVAAACPAAATTLHVPSAYPTIQAGLNAAVAGDTVEVACGSHTYFPDIFMKSGVVLRSETGQPECVVLSPAGGTRVFVCNGVYETTVVEGFTFTGTTTFSALMCSEHAAPTIRNCVIRDNRSYFEELAGGVTCWESSPVFEYCLFEGNSGWMSSVGGISFWDCDGTARYCTFRNNSLDAIFCSGGVLRMDHTTFAGSPTLGNVVVFGWGTTAWMDNCIFAFGYQAVDCYTTDVHATLTCCDIFGNQLGDWIGCIADQYGVEGNISADPQFCDLAAGDLALQCTSPCAPFTPPNPECDLIGAWPVGCGGTTVQRSTWGEIKGIFRR